MVWYILDATWWILMSRRFRICMAKGGRESLRPSYGRPKLTLISSIAEVVDFSFNQFHRQFCQITLHFVNLSLSFSRWLIFRLISFTASFCQMTLNFVNFSPPFRCSQSVEMQSHLAKMAVELIKFQFFQKILILFHGSTLKKLTLTFCFNFFYWHLYVYRKY